MSSTSRKPLYKKVQDYIRELIDTDRLAPGDRIPTEKELMEQFQVSKITVVHALSGLANEKVITRVPGRGSFVGEAQYEGWQDGEEEGFLGGADGSEAAAPDGQLNRTDRVEGSAAKAASVNGGVARSSGIVGIIIPFMRDQFAIRLIDGIRLALRESGYKPVVMLSEGSLSQEKEAIRILKEGLHAEGLVIFPLDDQQYNEEILSMKFSGFPFVLVDRYLPGVETDYIAADGKLGTELAFNYLWELGHREIAICSDSPLLTVTVQERLDGYMNALKKKGALINPAHMLTDFRMNGGGKDSLYRLVRSRLATAYITLNGELGVHLYQMAETAGLKVPEDVSIISFDDPTSIVEAFGVFTHIKQFEQKIGYGAGARVLEIINGLAAGRRREYSRTILEPQLVIGQTTAPPPKVVAIVSGLERRMPPIEQEWRAGAPAWDIRSHHIQYCLFIRLRRLHTFQHLHIYHLPQYRRFQKFRCCSVRAGL